MEDAKPSKNILRFANPVIKALLRSPLHRLVSKNFMLLTVTGRKTGRAHTFPVGRHQSTDGTFVLSAESFREEGPSSAPPVPTRSRRRTGKAACGTPSLRTVSTRSSIL